MVVEQVEHKTYMTVLSCWNEEAYMENAKGLTVGISHQKAAMI